MAIARFGFGEGWAEPEEELLDWHYRWDLGTVDRFDYQSFCNRSVSSPQLQVKIGAAAGAKEEIQLQSFEFQFKLCLDDQGYCLKVKRRQSDVFDLEGDFSMKIGNLWLLNTGWKKVTDTGVLLASWDGLQNKGSESLHIFCKLRMNMKVKLVEVVALEPSNLDIDIFSDRRAHRNLLSEDMAAIGLPFLADAAKFSDVTLICGNASFACHKVVLAARSDVFAAMFSHDETLEVASSTVNIVDLEPDVLEQTLKFIYTDSLSAGLESALGLLGAADKYNIRSLIAACEHLIVILVDIPGALPALVAAHFHGSDALKSFTLNYVKRHISKLENTPEWTKLFEGKNGGVSLDIAKTLLTSLIADRIPKEQDQK